MNCMETRGLSAKDICQIIGKCESAGVESFKLADIEIKFRPKRNEGVPTLSQDSAGINANIPIEEPTPIGESGAVLKQIEEKALDDAFESQAMVDDPLLFERDIVSRDIERQRELNG